MKENEDEKKEIAGRNKLWFILLPGETNTNTNSV